MNNQNTTMIAVAGVIAIAGHWSKKKTFNVAMVIGFFFIALFISVLAEFHAKLGFYLAVLVTTSVGLAYLPTLLQRTGLMSGTVLRQQNAPINNKMSQKGR